MAFYGPGAGHSQDRHSGGGAGRDHDASYMNRSTTGRAAPIPEPSGRSAGFNPRLNHDMDESDGQLPFRPEPIGIHPHGNAYYGREYRDRDRDYYHDDYRRRPEYEYEYRTHRDRDYLEGSRFGTGGPAGPMYGMNRGFVAPSSRSRREYEQHMHKLRLENPAVYKEWYRAFQANPHNPPPLPGYHHPMSSAASSIANYPASNFSTMPRAPSSASHYNESKRPGSGRSSVTDDYGPPSYLGGSNAPSVNNDVSSLPYDMYNNSSFMPIQDDSMYNQPSFQEPTVTPKFPGVHCFAIISPLGQLLTVKNGAAGIEVHSLESVLSHLGEYQKIKQFPGPLIRGKVHKHTVIAFCEKKIKETKVQETQVDREGFVLLWEFLILLLRQNGSIVGSDVAELLVRKEPEKSPNVPALKDEEEEQQPPEGESESEGEQNSDVKPVVPLPLPPHPLEKHISEAQAVKMFGDYLLFGHTKEALEYAMKSNLWGHALTLAFKMGEKEYKNVMTRFISGMPLSMPIVTLFEVMGGKSPASLANCCDSTIVGDWKQHLAIILSNGGWKPECETKSIITMGDTLGNKHHIFCSQFCYLMANLNFSPDSKLGPLLGLLPDKSNVVDAILMTEIYEFARTLADPHFSIGFTFLEYKYEYVKLLIDYGFSREAYSYCEEIVKHISQRDSITFELKWSILQVAERLKAFDESSEDPTWIANFKSILQIDDGEHQSLVNGVKVKEEIAQGQEHHEELQNTSSESSVDTKFNHIGQVQQPEVPQMHQQQQQYYQPPNIGTQSQQPEMNGGGNYYQLQGNEMNSVSESEVPDYYPNQQHQVDSQQQQQQGTQDNFSTGAQYYAPANTAYNPPAGTMQNGNGSYYPTYPTDPPSYAQQPTPTGMQQNKKKVRFEDEDLGEEESRGGAYEEKTASRTMTMTSPSNPNPSPKLSALKQTSFPAFTPSHPSQELALVSNDNENNENDNDEPENDNDAQLQSPTAPNPLAFKSTFPIDEPFGKLARRPTQLNKSSMSISMSKPKTFQIDEQCCDSQRPCDDHDSYAYGYQNQYSAAGPNLSSGNTAKDQQGAGDGSNMLNQQQQQNMYGNMPQLPPASEPNLAPASAPTPAPPAKKPEAGKGEKQGKEGKSTSWLGSLVPKFPSLKPKNQMILPDDKEPSIVWDDAKKQWVNVKGDEDDSSGPKGPPPTDFELTRNVNNNYAPPPMANMNITGSNFQSQQHAPTQVPSAQTQMIPGGPGGMPIKNEMMMNQEGNNNQTQNPAQFNSGAPPPSTAGNKYKLPKGRTLRSSYVDVFNPGSGTTISATGVNPNKPASAPFVPPLFNPGPPPLILGQGVEQPSFLTPGGFQPQQQPQSDNQGVPNVLQ